VSRTAKLLLVIEVVVCFLPITLVLVLGVIVLPMQVGLLVAGEFMALITIVVVAAGVGGLVALNSVLRWILSRPSDSMKPKMVRVLCMVGILPMLPFAFGDPPWVGVLPLICSAHLLYLGRQYVFAREESNSSDVPTA
jgi:hypothetical protein